MSKSIEDKIWAIIDVQGYPPAKPSETPSETDIQTKKIMKLIEPITAENERLKEVLRDIATRRKNAIKYGLKNFFPDIEKIIEEALKEI